ncbi:MAG: glycosyltransferase [Candidatus Goldbacteria bacterium]|nr:glycosyltransferase [Candidatus Goldiibacteriota bacterium]
MEEKLISIIIPVYKVEPYIKDCAESILNQTYKNLEILFIDDGSPDKCGEICDFYASVDNRVKVIHKKNGGPASAKNTGIKAAAGDFITFVDGDDIIEKQYCEILYKNLQLYNADISCCGIYTDFGYKKLKKINEKIKVFNGPEASEILPPSPCAKLYKKKMFDKIQFPEGLIMEDKFTTYKILYDSKTVVFTTAMLYNYRRRPDSIMGFTFKREHLLHLDAVKDMIFFYSSKGRYDIAFRKKKELVADAARFLINAIDSKENEDIIIDIKKRLKIAMQDCLFDNRCTIINKLEVLLYYFFPRLALNAAAIKRTIKNKLKYD